MNVKVLTFNVHKFRHPFFRKYLLKDLKTTLIKYNFDIVCLQELVGFHPPKHLKDYADGPLEHLADEIWNYYAYGKNAVYPKGHHGNAILSYYPIDNYVNYNISNNKFEKRGILHSQLLVKNRYPLDVMTLHLDLTEWGRRKQFQKLLRITEPFLQEGKPLIITGDFNDWRFTAHKALLTHGFHEVSLANKRSPFLTFPSFRPLLALDRIYYTGMHCIEAEVLKTRDWREMSDHLPVYAQFKLPFVGE